MHGVHPRMRVCVFAPRVRSMVGTGGLDDEVQPVRSEGVPSCLREQRFDALARANEVRIARSHLKRDLAAGTIDLVRLLSDPPVCAQTAMVRDLLLAVRKVGPARVNRAFARCRIADTKTVGGLSDRQRAALIRLLPL
jgi:hypothetical protein